MTSERVMKFRALLEELGRIAEELARDDDEVEALRFEVERLEALVTERDEEIGRLTRGIDTLLDERTRDREEVIARLKWKVLEARAALSAANEYIQNSRLKTKPEFSAPEFYDHVRRDGQWARNFSYLETES